MLFLILCGFWGHFFTWSNGPLYCQNLHPPQTQSVYALIATAHRTVHMCSFIPAAARYILSAIGSCGQTHPVEILLRWCPDGAEMVSRWPRDANRRERMAHVCSSTTPASILLLLLHATHSEACIRTKMMPHRGHAEISSRSHGDSTEIARRWRRDHAAQSEE